MSLLENIKIGDIFNIEFTEKDPFIQNFNENFLLKNMKTVGLNLKKYIEFSYLINKIDNIDFYKKLLENYILEVYKLPTYITITHAGSISNQIFYEVTILFPESLYDSIAKKLTSKK